MNTYTAKVKITSEFDLEITAPNARRVRRIIEKLDPDGIVDPSELRPGELVLPIRCYHVEPEIREIEEDE